MLFKTDCISAIKIEELTRRLLSLFWIDPSMPACEKNMRKKGSSTKIASYKVKVNTWLLGYLSWEVITFAFTKRPIFFHMYGTRCFFAFVLYKSTMLRIGPRKKEAVRLYNNLTIDHQDRVYQGRVTSTVRVGCLANLDIVGSSIFNFLSILLWMIICATFETNAIINSQCWWRTVKLHTITRILFFCHGLRCFFPGPIFDFEWAFYRVKQLVWDLDYMFRSTTFLKQPYGWVSTLSWNQNY